MKQAGFALFSSQAFCLLLARYLPVLSLPNADKDVYQHGAEILGCCGDS